MKPNRLLSENYQSIIMIRVRKQEAPLLRGYKGNAKRGWRIEGAAPNMDGITPMGYQYAIFSAKYRLISNGDYAKKEHAFAHVDKFLKKINEVYAITHYCWNTEIDGNGVPTKRHEI